MIEICPRNDKESYIRCTSNNLEDINNFMEALDTAKYKIYDQQYHLWVCDTNSAIRIRNESMFKDVGSGLKLPPYPYQKDAAMQMLLQPGTLIKMPCGSGKTPTALLVLSEMKRRNMIDGPAMFVVKASLKTQWLNEVSKFTDFKASVIETYKTKERKKLSQIRDREKKIKKLLANGAMENREAIADLDEEIKTIRNEANSDFSEMINPAKYDIFIVNFETLDDITVRKTLLKVSPQLIIVDEIDCIKDCKTKRSRNLAEFAKVTRYKYGATATPIRKNPKDIYGIFSFLVPDMFSSEEYFEDRYTKKYYNRIYGSKNEAELTSIVAPYLFIRSFEEIAEQLPAQMVVEKECELTASQIKMNKLIMKEIQDFKDMQETMASRFTKAQLAGNKEYERLNGAIVARQTFAQMLADDETLLNSSDSVLSKKYVTGSASSKTALCIDLIKTIVNSGEKVCVFSRFIGIQDIIENKIKELNDQHQYKDLRCARFFGSMNLEERRRVLEDYEADDNCQVLLLSDAAEAGINLGTTKYMIEFDLADSAAKQTQRHGRIQRADSIHKNVVVYQLIAKGSYDEIAKKIIEKKARYAEDIL